MAVVPDLDGTRVLVVGASSGVGRAVAATAIAAGARVVAAARRADALQQLVDEAGGGTPVTTDLTATGDCDALADVCRNELGGLDLVVNATGISILQRIERTTPEDWDRVLRTNVIGCNSLIQAVVDVVEPTGIIATLSSEAVTRPRAGLGAYTASKAALEASLAAWRHEHAPRRFSCIAIGATMPTDVSNGFDGELLQEMLGDWIGTGMIQTGVMATDALAASVLGLLATVLPSPDVNLEHVTLRSPAAVVGSLAAATG